MAVFETTIDHATIRRWVEARRGKPARVRAADGSDHKGILRIAFDGGNAGLQPIPWDVFFEVFDSSGLAFSFDASEGAGATTATYRFVLRAARQR